MQTFGNYLKKQREAKKISLKEIAHSTNVTERYLDSIEKDEFEKVPEGPYIRGYISLYATAIGISAHEALDRFDSQCRERNKAEDMQHGLSEQKIRQRSIILSLNKGKWLLICSAIVCLLIFGAYHLFFKDQNKSLVLANVQDPGSKALQTSHTMKSENNIPPLTINDYLKPSSRPEGLQKDMENPDNEKRAHDSSSLAREPNPRSKEFPKLAGLSSFPLEQTGELSKQTSSAKEVAGHSQNCSKIGKVTLTTLSDSELKQNSPDQIGVKKEGNAKPQKIQGPTRPAMEVASGELNAETSHHEKDMEVLETSVCTDIKGRNPSGRNDSFHWSIKGVYIWNLIKCDSDLSSIRHIYYFDGEKVSDILLDIRSPNWRTWSYKVIANKRFIGPWRVDITSADGELLKRVDFEINGKK